MVPDIHAKFNNQSFIIVGETGLVVIYTACKSLATWWGLFLGTSHFDLEGGQKYPPVGICGGAGSFPLELQIYLKKIASLSILDGFERSIHLWIVNDVYNFTKIATILNFHVNMPPSSSLWILSVQIWTHSAQPRWALGADKRDILWQDIANVHALLNKEVSVKVFKKTIKVHKSTQLCLQLKSCRDKSNVYSIMYSLVRRVSQ